MRSLYKPECARGSSFTALVWLGVVVLVAVSFSTSSAIGEDEINPLEPADTSSPRDTLKSYIEAWEDLYQQLQDEGEYANLAVRRIISCLDLSDVAPALRRGVSAQSAVCLKEVLDRLELPPWDEIPDVDQLSMKDENRLLPRWRIPGTEITIARVTEGPREGEYLFDAVTVEKAKDYFELIRHQPYQPGGTPGIYDWYLSDAGSMIPDEWIYSLPGWTRHTIYNTPVWKWFGLLVTLIVLIGVMVLIYRTERKLVEQLRLTNAVGYSFSLVVPIAAVSLPVLAKRFVTNQLALRGDVLNFVIIFLDLVFLLSLIVVVLGIGSRIAEAIIAQPRIHPRGLDAQFIRVSCRLASLVAAVVVFLEGGKQLGIPLSTLLAGAGVGGLALALAAQDALKNLFGSMMIFFDKPYRVGERIVTKGYDGTVEEIGLRSTRLRLLTGHLVTIPNEDMARSHIENIGRRPHIRRCTSVALQLDTPPEKVTQAVELIRNLLSDHEGMDHQYPPRVYFDEFNRDSLRIRIFYWYHPPNYWDFVAFGEKLNLRIIEAFKQADIQLAPPTQVTHMSLDEPQE